VGHGVSMVHERLLTHPKWRGRSPLGRTVNPVVLIFVVSLLFAGCGKVADPLPPLVQIPSLVADLSAKQLGKKVILSWSVPRLNTNGSEAATLESLEIFRVDRPMGESPLSRKQFSQAAILITTILKSAFDSYQEANKLVYADTLQGVDEKELFQRELSYAIRAVNNKKQSAGLSNISSLQIIPLPEPPRSLTPSYGEGFTELKWDPPERRIDGSPVTGEVQFNVYRSEKTTPLVFVLLTKTPIAETCYRDPTTVLDKPYVYMIRPVISSDGGFIESSDSAPLLTINRDVYPPKAPTELSGFSNGEFVSLVWIPNSEPDLAAYNVYRSEDGKTYHKLTQQRVTASSFIDRTVEKGKLYQYRIKAFDTHGNESAFSEEVGVRVE
jgi:hypothetical protein